MQETDQELDNLIIALDKSRLLADYPGAVEIMLLALYKENFEMKEDSLVSSEIKTIFRYCKNNNISLNKLRYSLDNNLTPIKNSESIKNYNNLYHKTLMIKITQENVDNYDKKDLFYPFSTLKTMEGSLKICEELRQKYGDNDAVYNEDLEKVATRKEIVKYKQSELNKFKDKYSSILFDKCKKSQVSQ